MATTTGTGTSFNHTTRVLANEEVQLISNTIRCHLYTQANQPVVTDEDLSDTNPGIPGGGYPGPITLTGKAVQLVSGKNHRFTANPIVFTASGGSMTDAYWYALYDDSNANDKLICFGQLDDTNNPVSAADGDNITINPNATEGFLYLPTTT